MANVGGKNGGTASEYPVVTRRINTAAANLAACGDSVRESTAVIQRSCETPGAHRSLPRSKIQELKRLSGFCDIAAVRLMDVGKRIRDDLTKEESLVELFDICRSIVGQLQSQQRGARHILNLLWDENAIISDHSPEGCRGRKGGNVYT